MIQETIEKLKVLQEILSEKFTVEREIQELPRALSTKNELVNRLKKGFVEKNERYDATRVRVDDLRTRLSEAERQRENLEKQMDQITTAREYDALDKEIREASDREQNFRKELQREEKELEEQSQRLEREEAMIRTQEEELAEEKEQIQSATEDKRSILAELAEQEKTTVPGLDEELLFKFERIIRSKEGEGIVPIRNGVCTGCQMILPNQFVNRVRDADEILFCPYCSKVVFYAEEEEEQTHVGFIDDDAEGLSDLVDDDFDEDLLDDEDLVGLDTDSEDRVLAEDHVSGNSGGEDEEEESDEDDDSDDDDDDDDDDEEEDGLEEDDMIDEHDGDFADEEEVED